jgi:hypothetical protein
LSNVLIITVNARKTISGTFNYYNLANTPLTHLVHVALYTHVGQDLVAEQDISVTGAYVFTNLCPDCEYEIVATSTHPTSGSVNTTDAAQVNYWPIVPYSIANGRFYAGDVADNNDFLNSTDAQRIQANFVNGTAFDRTGGWSFWKVGENNILGQISPAPPIQPVPTVTLLVDQNLTQNMYGLCIGDFNRSFNPSLAKAASTSLNLVYGATQQIGSNQEFELPLNIVHASQVGAVSLILNFPSDLVEVTDVQMNSTTGQLDWAVFGDELRIGWNSRVAADLASLEKMITLKLKTTSAFRNGAMIRFVLAADPLNELANNQYEVINNAILSVDAIEASANGIDDQANAGVLSLSNHPNPFKGYTTVSYSLPFKGMVTLELRDMLGSLMKTMVQELQPAGSHSLKLDAGTMSQGVYILTVRLTGSNDELVKTIKIVNNK